MLKVSGFRPIGFAEWRFLGCYVRCLAPLDEGSPGHFIRDIYTFGLQTVVGGTWTPEPSTLNHEP